MQLKVASLFKYKWPFCYHQTLKVKIHQLYEFVVYTSSQSGNEVTIAVKTRSIYWCAFSWSKPKFLWQLKQHYVVDLSVSTPQGQLILVQITKAFSCLALVYKLGWLQVSSKWFALYLLKGAHLGICRNGIFCTWAILFVFLASYIFKILSNVSSTINGKKANTNL